MWRGVVDCLDCPCGTGGGGDLGDAGEAGGFVAGLLDGLHDFGDGGGFGVEGDGGGFGGEVDVDGVHAGEGGNGLLHFGGAVVAGHAFDGNIRGLGHGFTFIG